METTVLQQDILKNLNVKTISHELQGGFYAKKTWLQSLFSSDIIMTK